MKNSNIKQAGPCFFIRSLTNNREKAKQYFFVIKSTDCSPSLVVKKLVLSKDLKLYKNNHKIIKQFKDYYLFEQRFGIKIETLKIVINALAEYLKK